MREEELKNSEADEADRVLLNTTSPEDRLWLAIRYVLGELSESELAQFEDCLSSDEAMCESLIEATRLVDALSVSCEEYHRQRSSVGSVRSAGVVHLTLQSELFEKSGRSLIAGGHPADSVGRRSLRGFSVLLALSVCLLLVVVLRDLSGQGRGNLHVSSGSEGTSGRSAGGRPLRQAHGNVVELMVARELLNLYTLETPGFAAGSMEESDTPSQSSELYIPDWLFAAVELQNASETEN